MRTFVIVFNDGAHLDSTLQSFTTEVLTSAVSDVAWHLVYAAPNRPARLKRWVSRSGWDRLTVERGRKIGALTISRLEAAGSSPVQMHGFVGDVWQQAVTLGRSLNAMRVLDARQREAEPRWKTEEQDASAAPAMPAMPAIVERVETSASPTAVSTAVPTATPKLTDQPHTPTVKLVVRKRWTLAGA